jgi:hypothetical protein
MSYTIKRVDTLPGVQAEWASGAWEAADTITIEHFWPLEHQHEPKTAARMVHDGETIAVMFRVADNYIVAKGTQYQDRTHLDSCAELFIEPVAGKGYLNFEFNCGGTLLLTYIEDARRTETGFEKYAHVPAEVVAGMEVHTSLAAPVDPEITVPTTWTLSYTIPKRVFETYAGPIETLSGMTLRGNVYKCADESSHPHWGYWADIGDELNFHQPDKFVALELE